MGNWAPLCVSPVDPALPHKAGRHNTATARGGHVGIWRLPEAPRHIPNGPARGKSHKLASGGVG